MSDITTIKIIEFPSTGLLPHYIADEKGFFYEEGIDVEITATPNSVFQITNLIDGNFIIKNDIHNFILRLSFCCCLPSSCLSYWLLLDWLIDPQKLFMIIKM